MSNKRIKVLYIFAGERKEMERKCRKGEMPDTYFIGMKFDIPFISELDGVTNQIE